MDGFAIGQEDDPKDAAVSLGGIIAKVELTDYDGLIYHVKRENSEAIMKVEADTVEPARPGIRG